MCKVEGTQETINGYFFHNDFDIPTKFHLIRKKYVSLLFLSRSPLIVWPVEPPEKQYAKILGMYRTHTQETQ